MYFRYFFPASRCLCVCVLCFFLSDCGPAGSEPTPRPTQVLSAPTLAASPTIHIQTSGELYGESDVNPGQLEPTAASLPSGASLPPLVMGTPGAAGIQKVQIVLEDGTLLIGDLYERGISRVPGVLLIAPDKNSWGFLPVRLQTAGMTVLVVESRETPLPTDMDILMLSLSEIGTVDPARIAVVGAERGAEMALPGCAANMICDALVLLSPANRDGLIPALNAYNPRPVLLAAGQDDTAGYTTSVALAGAAAAGQLLTYPDGKGTALLQGYPELIDAIVAWLSELPVNQPGT